MVELNYTYDSKALLPEVKAAIDSQMTFADLRDRDADWVNLFTKDAYIWRNGKESKGTKEIEEMITTSWNNVKKRNHCPEKVFVSGEGGLEVMIDGHTDYYWEDGTGQTGKWGARIHFTKVDGELKIKEYSVVFVFYKSL